MKRFAICDLRFAIWGKFARAALILTLAFSLQPLALSQVTATNVAIYPSPSGPYFYAHWLNIVPEHKYQLQNSADAVHWFFLATVTNSCSTNAAWVQTTPLGIHPKCFFRIQEQ